MEDPITSDFASRVTLEEEEEYAISRSLPDLYSRSPTIDVRWE